MGSQFHTIAGYGTIKVKSPFNDMQYNIDIQYVLDLSNNLQSIG